MSSCSATLVAQKGNKCGRKAALRTRNQFGYRYPYLASPMRDAKRALATALGPRMAALIDANDDDSASEEEAVPNIREDDNGARRKERRSQEHVWSSTDEDESSEEGMDGRVRDIVAMMREHQQQQQLLVAPGAPPPARRNPRGEARVVLSEFQHQQAQEPLAGQEEHDSPAQSEAEPEELVGDFFAMVAAREVVDNVFEDILEQRRSDAIDSGAGTSVPVSSVPTASDESSSGRGMSMSTSDNNRWVETAPQGASEEVKLPPCEVLSLHQLLSDEEKRQLIQLLDDYNGYEPEQVWLADANECGWHVAMITADEANTSRRITRSVARASVSGDKIPANSHQPVNEVVPEEDEAQIVAMRVQLRMRGLLAEEVRKMSNAEVKTALTNMVTNAVEVEDLSVASINSVQTEERQSNSKKSTSTPRNSNSNPP